MMTKNDDSDSKSDSKGDSTDVNDYIDKNTKLDWNESKFKKLKVGKDSAKSIMKTYCKASDADYTISTVREDEFKKELTVFFITTLNLKMVNLRLFTCYLTLQRMVIHFDL